MIERHHSGQLEHYVCFALQTFVEIVKAADTGLRLTMVLWELKFMCSYTL